MIAIHSKEPTDCCFDGGFRIMEIDHSFCSDEVGGGAMKRRDVGKKDRSLFIFF